MAPRMCALMAVLVMTVAAAACSETAVPDAAPSAPPPSSSNPSPEASPTPEPEEPDEPDPVEAARPDPLRPSALVVPRLSGRVLLMLAGRPQAATIPSLVGGLDELGVRALFMMPGRWVAKHPDEVAAVIAAGHRVGNAGWSGPAPEKHKELRSWIRDAEGALVAAGADPRPYLYPGREDETTLKVAGRLGYRGVVPGDGTGAGIASIALRDNVMRKVKRVLKVAERDGLQVVPPSYLRKVRPVHWDVALTPGFEGSAVRRLQLALAAARFVPGAPDGVFGSLTLEAVYAFEKYTEAERDGIVDPLQQQQILSAAPASLAGRSAAHQIEVDLSQQLLYELDGGEVVRVIPVSTGNGEAYDSRGTTAIARTPVGSYEVYRKVTGWRISHLGGLYYPSYFVGGYAIHGSTSVPPYPASHGCIRVPMEVAIDLFESLPIGTPVTIHE